MAEEGKSCGELVLVDDPIAILVEMLENLLIKMNIRIQLQMKMNGVKIIWNQRPQSPLIHLKWRWPRRCSGTPGSGLGLLLTMSYSFLVLLKSSLRSSLYKVNDSFANSNLSLLSAPNEGYKNSKEAEKYQFQGVLT